MGVDLIPLPGVACSDAAHALHDCGPFFAEGGARYATDPFALAKKHAGYADVRIVGFSDSNNRTSSTNGISTNTSTSSNSSNSSNSGSKPKQASASTEAACAPPHGKFSVVPYGESKPKHPNVRDLTGAFETFERLN